MYHFPDDSHGQSGKMAAIWKREQLPQTLRPILTLDGLELGTRCFPAALPPVAVAIHLQDADMVGEAVQQRSGKAFRPQDTEPVVEMQISGPFDGALMLALT